MIRDALGVSFFQCPKCHRPEGRIFARPVGSNSVIWWLISGDAYMVLCRMNPPNHRSRCTQRENGDEVSMWWSGLI